ncbi:hypothetical protein PPACK8108_LOCUS16259 [Phakopsora pachyrhizi]|uniref:Uncharacterized protein n=1 Tax=Phakopsora pachyrhizi TaxID=170000 RepID=A0AAV0BA71_PHAPC|nr:hypothetical protein PPACK8108_LOCUS16259 [Phakopsora pachyrhizi]
MLGKGWSGERAVSSRPGHREGKLTALVPDEVVNRKGVEEDREEVSGDGAQCAPANPGGTGLHPREGTNSTDYLLQRKADRERC